MGKWIPTEPPEVAHIVHSSIPIKDKINMGDGDIRYTSQKPLGLPANGHLPGSNGAPRDRLGGPWEQLPSVRLQPPKVGDIPIIVSLGSLITSLAYQGKAKQGLLKANLAPDVGRGTQHDALQEIQIFSTSTSGSGCVGRTVMLVPILAEPSRPE